MKQLDVANGSGSEEIMSVGGQQGELLSRVHNSLRSGGEIHFLSGGNPGRGRLFKCGSGLFESLLFEAML